jgi:hypothetical protein
MAVLSPPLLVRLLHVIRLPVTRYLESEECFMKSLLAILFICLAANAQTREELHKRYGSPIIETFTIRPGVSVTVSYAETGEVCEMIIHPQQLTSALDYPITKTMQSKAVTEVIDELVPISQRGKRLIGSFLNHICLPLNNCWGVMDSYERVTILRNGGDDKERYARIRWKETSCRE